MRYRASLGFSALAVVVGSSCAAWGCDGGTLERDGDAADSGRAADASGLDASGLDASGMDARVLDASALACSTPLAERIRITDVPVGTAVSANEDEVALRPIAISAIPSGGSRLAFMGADGDVHVVTLDESDHVTGSPVTIAANDFADLHADDTGGVLLVTRDAQGGGSHGCGTVTNLCGPADSLPSDADCYDMYLVRFDGTRESWATKLTDSSASRPPYLNGPTDRQNTTFIWWYAHHGRIASDGSRYAAYYGAAISVSETCGAGSANTTGVNIHQGDQMRVVDANGAIVSGGFDWGCSHSGYERVAWDATAQTFVAVCKTDNQNRIAIAPAYSTIRPVDLWYSNFGSLVIEGGQRWLIVSDRASGQPQNQDGNAEVHMLRFTSGQAAQDVVVASGGGRNHRAPHLASYGSGELLAMWESSSAPGDLAPADRARELHVRLYDRSTGEPRSDAVRVSGVTGNRYHALRSFPDGSAAFPIASASANSVRVLRVLPCR